MKEVMDTFVLVHNNEVISPQLVTIRSYANWFEQHFDEYTSRMELYMKSKKQNGEVVLEWHPGTRIGAWFDGRRQMSPTFQPWFIEQDSSIMDRLVKLKLAEQKDAIPLAVKNPAGKRILRIYAVSQVELYIRSLFDKNFKIAPYIAPAKQIIVRDSEMDKFIAPKTDTTRRKLF